MHCKTILRVCLNSCLIITQAPINYCVQLRRTMRLIWRSVQGTRQNKKQEMSQRRIMSSIWCKDHFRSDDLIGPSYNCIGGCREYDLLFGVGRMSVQFSFFQFDYSPSLFTQLIVTIPIWKILDWDYWKKLLEILLQRRKN